MLMVVSMKTGAGFEAAPPVPLFQTRMPGVGAFNPWGNTPNYAVTPDGQQFLVNTIIEEHAVPTTIVLNWPAMLRR
jgi:hypothetical protein